MGAGQRRERGAVTSEKKNKENEKQTDRKGQRGTPRKRCAAGARLVSLYGGIMIGSIWQWPRPRERKECAKCLPSEYQPRTEADTRQQIHVAALTFAVSHLDVGLGVYGCQGGKDVDNGARGDGHGVQQCVLNALTKNTLGVAAPFGELSFGTAATRQAS
ncbi:hypothetical protein MGG_17481 [Pyricularia oryzae 70-15]|uniref:Uncharacterized protein n=3 Tax=Pyricularia oryzae TaxID=318829 RepID=G4ND13_PYRO7|nr:uncharacterized protein MGG_17481 [Pyricularia oryzae 70-15]EHA49203.1 hypothetical protein MGG_17481 [Pyricularia oryzae 70-15]ELQ37300.1 hypothetical protein OOU_Y34scaffold00608g67 [Pyricularia oryzae Y34]KAI7921317.1 hypothetical protein M9X92_005484 [Pyricularia oryzae]KAI7925730.1 hypothetical protein M0657_004045 [Pyricularia oryzae]